MDTRFKAIVIGGSAGCLNALFKILGSLPASLDAPVIIVLHRLKNVVSEMDQILSLHSPGRPVIEPDDKEPVKTKGIYLAPQNYHLLIEDDETFSLDYSEPVHFSRPSIDVTFESVANVYTSGVLALLLSGANSDGTAGVEKVLQKNGVAIVQDPATAEYSFMPQHAISNNIGAKVLTPDAIRDYLQLLK